MRYLYRLSIYLLTTSFGCTGKKCSSCRQLVGDEKCRHVNVWHVTCRCCGTKQLKTT